MGPSLTMQSILAANQQYLAGNAGQATVSGNVLIVACMSVKLNRHLPAALGLAPGACYMVRNPGPTITSHDNSVLRGALIAIATGKVRQIIVVGHPDCSAAMEAGKLIDAIQAAGVPRSRLDSDLRGWLGLTGPVKANIRGVVEELASHPSLPQDVPVLGLLMDDRDGGITAVCEATRGVGASASETPPKLPASSQTSAPTTTPASPQAPAAQPDEDAIAYSVPLVTSRPSQPPPKPLPSRPVSMPPLPPPVPPASPQGATKFDRKFNTVTPRQVPPRGTKGPR